MGHVIYGFDEINRICDWGILEKEKEKQQAFKGRQNATRKAMTISCLGQGKTT